MMTPEEFAGHVAAVEREIAKVIVGQRDLVRAVILGLLCEGHILLEGVPGLGKTLLLRTLGEALSVEFGRAQFTPDLMPADILGTNVLEDGRFRFHEGPIFANVVLADEVNRATPKTQSALLEAMQERRVTLGGTTHPLPRPFFVMATQNPLEMEGTYPRKRKAIPSARIIRLKWVAKHGRLNLLEPQTSQVLNLPKLIP
jgi:MoxR-like ATPase